MNWNTPARAKMALALCAATTLGGCQSASPPDPRGSAAGAAAANPFSWRRIGQEFRTIRPPGQRTPLASPEEQRREAARAAAEAEAAVRAQPSDPALRHQAAEFYSRAGRPQEAVPHLRKATELAPEEPLYWVALGEAATQAKMFPVAEQAFARAETLEPGSAPAARGRGLMLAARGQHAPARAVLEQAIARHPEDLDLRAALGRFHLRRGEARAAIQALRPVAGPYQSRPDLHFLLAQAYEKDGQAEAAVGQLRKAVHAAPRAARIWARLGLLLVKLDRARDAREPFQRAIQLEPTNPAHYRGLGDSYRLQPSPSAENLRQAAAQYRAALALRPNDKLASASLAKAVRELETVTRTRQPDIRPAAGRLQTPLTDRGGRSF